MDAIAIPPDDVTPSVAAGNIAVTGINTVPTAITDLDDPIPGATYTIITGDVANASTIADGGNFTLCGAWNPATIGDSIVLYCYADNDYREVSRTFVAAAGGPVYGDPFLAGPGAVGAPAYSYQADPDTGTYWIGANSFGQSVGGALVVTYDGTGCIATGFNGPIGTVTPAQGEFTNIYGADDFYFGQDPADLHEGYKERGDYITFIDTFDVGNNADLAVRWDLTNVVGAGTNDETTTDGWNVLTTGGAGGPDSESTVSWGLNHYRAYAPKMELVVDIGTLAGSEFYCGFYAAANEYVEIRYDASVDGNWHLSVDDTAGADDVDSGVAATLNPTKLEIAVAADGTVSWAIDDVAMGVVGMTNQMTANAHYLRWYGAEEAAAARVFSVDYVIVEQLRQQ